MNTYYSNAQLHNQVFDLELDSMIQEVKALTKFESGLPIAFDDLENYCWRIRSAYWDSIYVSKGGKTIKYPDPPDTENYFCDSNSLEEKTVFNKLINIKKRTTDDMLVELANKSSSEITIYCFLLLCADDNPKSKKILNHYLHNKSEVWLEYCGRRTKIKTRDFMLNRLFRCLFYDGRIPMITNKEFTDYEKAVKDYDSPGTTETE